MSTSNPNKPRVGVWMIGARGAVATTTIVGVRAAARGLLPLVGCTTEGPRGEGLDFVGADNLVFGGWEKGPGSLLANATALGEQERIFDPRLLEPIRPDLESIDLDIVNHGTCGVPSPTSDPDCENAVDVVRRLRADLARFRARHDLERIVVVNVSSTEAVFTVPEELMTLAGLEASIESARGGPLRASTLYAYASLREHAAFLNFAASPAALVPAIRELAEREGVPIMGSDGKTGETLIKSALAPMFRERALRVTAWHGSNVLGNADGRTLSDPATRAAKIESKDGVVRSILGYSPDTSVDITYAPSFGDWKTAWDVIQFQGFLGTRMSMQFTWQGSDSILAAPLVIDLVRFADLALRRAESGPMVHVAAFFKSPVGTPEHELSRQYSMLDAYLRRARIAPVETRKIASR